MNTIDFSRQSSLQQLFQTQPAVKELRDKQSALCQQLSSPDAGAEQKKQLAAELQEVNARLGQTVLAERTDVLEAEQYRKNTEAARNKRKRDRDLYGKHQEHFIFRASTAKLLTAKAGLRRPQSWAESTPAAVVYPGDRSSAELSHSAVINREVNEAQEIALEEAREARRHKRKISRELQREAATGIKRSRDYPEPADWGDFRYRRSRRRSKVDIQI